MTALLTQAKTITNWPDQELADLCGISRSLVNGIVTGRLEEHLDHAQRQAVIEAVRHFVEETNELFEAMELLG